MPPPCGIPQSRPADATFVQLQTIGTQPHPHCTGARGIHDFGTFPAPALDDLGARMPEAVAGTGRDQGQARPGGGNEARIG